ncbi:alkaline phosphatase family protein [Heliomicrobium modesticaldum Ice1]|uniref:Alkaline phosphatase family protein n=1 Tax=Heliobacterium modesticaldum (strain ATCC 51547 / Ice1) TaxID=498761 RepID=B0TC33_HELMI|nr:alkaline phosphatase [Heliomicrobium modesticaldum]ABZ85306.1 alkaline phosphatase family protein [Heliomicrobium modesticaldum Ice1]
MNKATKNMIAAVIGTAMLLTSLSPALAAGASTSQGKAKNVIFMLSDGNSIGGTTLTRWYNIAKSKDPQFRLAIDDPAFTLALQRTFGANSIITDSAPAGTAYSTGFKSDSGYISVLPDKINIPGAKEYSGSEPFKPVATVLEGAKLMGKATGIVSTSQIQHASPAATSAHWYKRSNYEEIAKQQVYQDIDVVLGGGAGYLGQKRADGQDLIKVIKQRGYDYVTDTGKLKASKAEKIWGMFADVSLDRDIDRNPAQQPSLAEMTQAAIERLSKDKDGFFLFVEGSEVDWSAHANDPVGLISEINAFDRAVKVALDFAKKDKNTLLIVTTDHGNGGITIGNSLSDESYDTMPLETVMAPLLKVNRTSDSIVRELPKDATDEQIKEAIAKYYSITDMTDEELAEAKKWLAKDSDRDYGIGRILSKRARIGWTTHGHTGEDVLVFSYGPHSLSGLLDNTDAARVMAKAMGFDLADVNRKLMVNAKEAFAKLGAKCNIDATDAKNPVVVVEKDNVKAKLPISTDIIIINDKADTMTGLTVRGKEDASVYVPQEAVDRFAAALKASKK